MANRVLIDIMDKNKHDAGTKARNDVSAILNSMGFETTVMFNRTHGSVKRALEVMNAASGIGKDISSEEIIVLQYPYKPGIMNLMLGRIDIIRKKTGCRLVIIIHDVVYMRNESYVSQTVEEMRKLEVGFFNSADAVIAHNPAMIAELKSAGVTVPLYNLQLFDYLYDGKPCKIADADKPTVIYAGNLSQEKSGFIYSYSSSGKVLFNLYGTKPAELASEFSYKGSFPPDELIENMEGNYGLVWDGPEADTCSGNYGAYLKLNDPHKFSLYMASGIPAVVWSESALAPFVKENGLGVTVSSLAELDNLPAPSSAEYQQMRSNVEKMKQIVCSGQRLKNIVNEILRSK